MAFVHPPKVVMQALPQPWLCVQQSLHIETQVEHASAASCSSAMEAASRLTWRSSAKSVQAMQLPCMHAAAQQLWRVRQDSVINP